MPSLVDDLEMVTIARCGHWTQQEHPEELNRILVDWLRRRFAAAT
jgi:pimeloyl-ACP methyl ester carboxylesterase